MTSPLQEKQELTDTLGRLNEDRYFARHAAADRRAIAETERRLAAAGGLHGARAHETSSPSAAGLRSLGWRAAGLSAVALIGAWIGWHL